MASSKAKVHAGAKSAVKTKKHYCPEHGEECRPTMHGWPHGVMKFHCPQGCELTKKETILR